MLYKGEKMANNLGQIIKQIIDMDREDIFLNSKCFNALLDDLAPDLTIERKIFHRAVSDEVLMMVKSLKDDNQNNKEFELLKIKKKLEDEYGLSESWSNLIVSGFAYAFGISCDFTIETLDNSSKYFECPICGYKIFDILPNNCPICNYYFPSKIKNSDNLKRVIMLNCGGMKISVIKEIRILTGAGLAEAKNMTEQTPSVLIDNVSEKDAINIKKRFESIGAKVKIIDL